jgi:hypothetical protein
MIKPLDPTPRDTILEERFIWFLFKLGFYTTKTLPKLAAHRHAGGARNQYIILVVYGAAHYKVFRRNTSIYQWGSQLIRGRFRGRRMPSKDVVSIPILVGGAAVVRYLWSPPLN